MFVRKNNFFVACLKYTDVSIVHSSIVHTCLIKTLSLQALGEDTDFAKPHTMRVIEKFLVDCSEAVSKRYTRYDCVIKVINGRGRRTNFLLYLIFYGFKT